jgi:hypothetical protein
MRLRPFFCWADARFSWATLRRRASIKLTRLVREGSSGRSIRSPFCLIKIHSNMTNPHRERASVALWSDDKIVSNSLKSLAGAIESAFEPGGLCSRWNLNQTTSWDLFKPRQLDGIARTLEEKGNHR